MRKFGAGMVCMLVLLAVVLGVWLSLGKEARGIIVGVGLGIAGAVCGAAFALAGVAILLLLRLRWDMQSKPQAPIVLGGGYPVPAGYLETPYSVHSPPATPHWNRPARHFRFIGGDDARGDDAGGQEEIPGTRPPAW